jgi:tRNA (guanine26-N2/guanine27-N2)-dimethyltransferase
LVLKRQHLILLHSKMTTNTKEIVEGCAIMTYPADQEQTVFYNPVQVQNRDLSILMISLYGERRRKRMHLREYRKKLRTEEKLLDEALNERLTRYEATLDATELLRSENTTEEGLTILDALAASGLRSIRYWKEIPGVKHVTINDLDPAAVERAHANLAVNNLTDVLLKDTDDDRGHGIRIQCGDATHEMYLSRRAPNLHTKTPPQLLQKDQFDIIDLDPYGSAAPFVDAAVQAVRDGGMLCVTCTDMAALGGSHPETAYGRYGSMPIQRAKYLQEFALRILLHTLAVSAARYGRTIRPILSVGMAFYVRVFVEVNNDKAGVSTLDHGNSAS